MSDRGKGELLYEESIIVEFFTPGKTAILPAGRENLSSIEEIESFILTPKEKQTAIARTIE